MKRLDKRTTTVSLWHIDLDNRLDDAMLQNMEEDLLSDVDEVLYFRLDNIFTFFAEEYL